jgi:hypothetical protein
MDQPQCTSCGWSSGWNLINSHGPAGM